MQKPLIGRNDIIDAAQVLGCEPAAVQAVAIVEAAGAGFNPDDSPKSLFEGHHFHRLTKGRFAAANPTLSFPKWTREHYGRTWQDEQYRLEHARKLDDTAALLATSFGKFQIMGFNHAACGFRTVQDFHAAMCESEVQHLAAFVQFIVARGLADEMRDGRWADFARSYNGPGYAANRYDTKLAQAYAAAKPVFA